MPARRVEEDRVVDRDAAAARPAQAGDDVEQRRLACARRAAKREHPAGSRGYRRDREIALRVLDRDLDHRRRPAWRGARRAPRRRPARQRRSPARSPSAATSSPRRRDPASRCRSPSRCLRLAGNVGDEGDRRAEFADRLGEAENEPGDDPRRGERQRHGREDEPGAARPAFAPPVRAARRPPRSTAGSRAPSGESPSPPRRAPRPSSEKKT